MAASYPTSVKSFTTKVDNVDDVLAAHVNDLQDEVVALETACGVGKASSLIQRVCTTNSSYSSGAGTIPDDDTIPQVGEGNSAGVDVTIQMKVSTNKLLFHAHVNVGNTAGTPMFWAIFKDGGANAIGSGFGSWTGANEKGEINLTFEYAPGDTSSHTYALRVGGSSGTTHINGDPSAAARRFGGTAVSVMSVVELKA